MKIILVIIFQFFLNQLFAQTALNFLKMENDVKMLSKGSSFDVSSMLKNPAFCDIKSSEIVFNYIRYPQDIIGMNAIYGVRLKDNTIAFGINQVKVEEIEGRDENRNITGSFKSADNAILMGYNKTINEQSIGMVIKYITSKIENENANTFAFDFGYKVGIKRFKLGFTINNISNGIRYRNNTEKLPLILSMQMSYLISSVLIGVNIDRDVYNRENVFKLAMEYGISEQFYFRGGFNNNGDDISDRIDGGFGIRIKNSEINLGISRYINNQIITGLNLMLKY